MKVSIIMPVYNGESTLQEVFQSLEGQCNKALVEEIIFVDDGSRDNSRKAIGQYALSSSYKIKIITHEKPMGLARGYNEGIDACSSSLFVLMHQDIVLSDRDSYAKIMAPLTGDDVVASYPVLITPYAVWEKYNFWQKCMFSRHLGKKASVFTGKFDCIRKTPLRFNSIIYRTGGEDADYYFQLKKRGKIIPTDVEVIHIHDMRPDFSVYDIFRKEAQFGEIYGVQIRRLFVVLYREVSCISLINLFVRPGLVFLLFIPYLRYLAGAGILLFCFFYTKTVYTKCYKDWRILLLPAVNFIGMVVHSLGLLKGFIHGRQTI